MGLILFSWIVLAPVVLALIDQAREIRRHRRHGRLGG